MKRLAIIGGGDLGQQIANLARCTGNYNPVCIFDDFAPLGLVAEGVPVVGKIHEAKNYFEKNFFDEAIIAIGYKHLSFKKALSEQLQNAGLQFATIIHPSVIYDKSCSISPGTVIYKGCIIDSNVSIGPHTIVNCGCVIAHDTKILGYSFLSPSVNIAGFVVLDILIHVGIGATIIDRICLCSGLVIGAGSLVVSSIEKSGVYYGVPARFRREL